MQFNPLPPGKHGVQRLSRLKYGPFLPLGLLISDVVAKDQSQMKTIGMLGGMSWESTSSFYRAINEGINESLGGLHSAKISMVSVDFDELEKLQHADD
ncbi:MAG: hypothetical protein QGG54_21840, partial [Gammaproteobacteria bacterium]|nr:hypothetical protein [Gammaproteobacteria bacterium]